MNCHIDILLAIIAGRDFLNAVWNLLKSIIVPIEPNLHVCWFIHLIIQCHWILILTKHDYISTVKLSDLMKKRISISSYHQCIGESQVSLNSASNWRWCCSKWTWWPFIGSFLKLWNYLLPGIVSKQGNNRVMTAHSRVMYSSFL